MSGLRCVAGGIASQRTPGTRPADPNCTDKQAGLGTPAANFLGFPTETEGRQTLGAVSVFLSRTYANPYASTITRRPGQPWRSEPAPWSQTRIAGAVHDPSLWVGIRPEGQLRAIVIDIDRKADHVSPYWHPAGQSRQLLKLEQQARAAGCGFTLVRSSASGGLHAWVTLPQAIKAWFAYWVGLELVTRAGMAEGAGHCELFPSRHDYIASDDRQQWSQSHGVRLPGQQGSALIAGNRTASDCEIIYQDLIGELDGTAINADWEALLEAAAGLHRTAGRSSNASARISRRRPCSRAHGVAWSEGGQSRENLAKLTTWARMARPDLATVEALGDFIRDTAYQCPGFDQWASEATKLDLARPTNHWGQRWARSSLKRDRHQGAPAPTCGDKHHNSRLAKLSRAALTRVWKQGENAKSWSQRKVAEISGLTRATVCKHWDFWRQLFTRATSAEGWHTPPSNGGSQSSPVLGPDPDFGFDRLKTAVPIPPATPAMAPTPAANDQTKQIPDFWSDRKLDLAEILRRNRERLALSRPPTAPAIENQLLVAKRNRERAEMMAWLEVAA